MNNPLSGPGVKYCPECGAEYQEWLEKCVDCGVKLVWQKPDIKGRPVPPSQIVDSGGRRYVKEKVASVASYETLLEAQFNRGVLESEGIESMVVSAQSLIGYQPDTSSVGNIRLVVKESDVKKAKEILDSIQKDVPEGDFSDDGDIEVIPMDDDGGPPPVL